jgi:hypothetical protein
VKIKNTFHKTTGLVKNLDTKVPPVMAQQNQGNDGRGLPALQYNVGHR